MNEIFITDENVLKLLNRNQHTFSVEDQIANISGFAGHMGSVSVVTT